MDNLPSSGPSQSSVNHLIRSLELLTGYGAWEWDIVSGDIHWFGVSGRLIGSLPEQSDGNIQDFTDVLHPDDRTRVWQTLNSVMARRQIPYADEYRFILPDGSVRWMSGTGRFYYDDAGKAVRMTGVVQDITERQRAQEALRESEERFAKAFRASPHPIGITEATTGRCIEVNDACLQLFGFRREEVIGNTTLMLGIWPNGKDRARLVERLQAGEPVRNLELSFKTKAGDVRHILVSSDLAELNGTLCLITVGNDITECKQAEAKLQESEARFRNVFEHAGIGIAISSLYGGAVQCNPAYCAMLGYTEEEIRHLDFSQVVHPDDRDANLAEIKRLLTEKLPHFEIENRYVRKNGEPVWVHKFISLLRDHEGRPRFFVALVTDITERKQAETKLRESETRFRNVFEHAGTGIAIGNLEGNLVQCNPAFCAMVGYTEDELRYVDFSQVVHPDDRDADLVEIKRLLREELPYFEIENRYVHKNGEPVWVRKFISLLRDHEGRPRSFVALVTDITEHRRTEQELHQAKEHLQRWALELEKAVNEKTVELVHSQTRLRSLAGELGLAEQRERKRLAGELHDHLQQLLVLGRLVIGQGKQSTADNVGCKTVLQRVDDILSEALTYSRTLVTELSPPVLRDHGLGAGLKWLGAYMKKHGQTVTVKVPEGEIQLSEDQVILLYQSVRELLINSSKHAGSGQATVTMRQADGDLCITVNDDGAGFDLAAAAAAAAGPYPSGGISSKFGLFSIQERMRAMGGKFDLHSVPGEGTMATLILPLSSQS